MSDGGAGGAQDSKPGGAQIWFGRRCVTGASNPIPILKGQLIIKVPIFKDL